MYSTRQTLTNHIHPYKLNKLHLVSLKIMFKFIAICERHGKTNVFTSSYKFSHVLFAQTAITMGPRSSEFVCLFP